MRQVGSLLSAEPVEYTWTVKQSRLFNFIVPVPVASVGSLLKGSSVELLLPSELGPKSLQFDGMPYCPVFAGAEIKAALSVLSGPAPPTVSVTYTLAAEKHITAVQIKPHCLVPADREEYVGAGLLFPMMVEVSQQQHTHTHASD